MRADVRWLVAAACCVVWAASTSAQVARTTLRGQVVAADGTGVPGLEVTLAAEDGARIATVTTDDTGRFIVGDIAPGRYRLDAASGSLVARGRVDLGATPVTEISLQLRVPSDDPLEVVGVYDGFGRAMSEASGDVLRTLPARMQSRALPQALAAMPGWAEEDNGLLHVRGVDDGVLYVEDGVPIYDRLDVAFGIPPSLAGVGTMTVTTGHTPAQFGLKSGAVIHVASPPAEPRWSGELQTGGGTSAVASAAASGGGPVSQRLDVFGSIAGERSDRFLDPVHPDNLHNTGGVAGGTLRARLATGREGQVTAQGRSGRSRYDVPHGAEAEAAGQDQQQRITQHGAGLAYQQPVGGAAWFSAAAYGRRVDAHLDPSAGDVPLTASSARRQSRAGLLASWGRSVGRHVLSIGGEASRITLREDFRFAVTDDDADDLSDAALAFTPARPFVFADRAARTQWSTWAQDHVYAGRLTVDAGVRFDRTSLLVEASQWSPRLGAALDLPALGATVRGSFNRFFQPPQVEHLLLASSDAARVLSPFVDGDEGGGAEVAPERQTAWEAGWEQRLPASLRLDVAAWHRSVRNYADPNVFFGTTIVFPNSVARGTARGLDVRLTLPPTKGWTASASYTLSKVEQEGPINGGLFLEDDIDDIGEGVVFTPDHDQRHVASAMVSWVPPAGRWSASAQARYASGTPLEVGELDDDDLEELLERPGSDLIDVDRGRVTPRLVVDVTASVRLRRTSWGAVSVGASVLNAFDRRYAFNFGNPFSGTHFGAPRQFRVDLTASFR